MKLDILAGSERQMTLQILDAGGGIIPLSDATTVMLFLVVNGHTRPIENITIESNVVKTTLTAEMLSECGEYSVYAHYEIYGSTYRSERVYIFDASDRFFKDVRGVNVAEDSSLLISVYSPVIANNGGGGGGGGSVDIINDLASDRTDAALAAAQGKALKNMVPVSVSQLTNDLGYITRAVSDLINYYTKSETYTQSQVNAIVADISTTTFKAVDQLPTSDISTTTIYLVPNEEGAKDEYIYIEGQWELIGNTGANLEGYATEAWVNSQIGDFITNDALTTILTGYTTTADLSNYKLEVSDGYVKSKGYSGDDEGKYLKVAGGKIALATGGGGGGSVDIINDLTSDRTDAALAATQGKVLDAKITQLSSEVVVSVVAQTSGDIELANNTQFTYSTVPSEITISLPSDWDSEDLSIITFNTGEAAPQITFPEGIGVKGSIEANKSIEINIYNNNAIILNV